MPTPFTIHFTFVRDTKNTYRYEEQAEQGFEKIGVIYIRKTALGPLPSPEITVTVEDRKD